jgi:hypothetical protein
MQGLIRFLRSLGAIGTAAATALQILTTNLAVVMTTIFAWWVIASEWAVSMAHHPRVQAGAFAFLACLWTIIGVQYLRDRRRPTVTTPFQDYRYGLTYEGLHCGYDPTNDEAALQIGIHLRNFSPGPLSYRVERFAVQIESRVVPRQKGAGSASIYMARGAGRISRNLPFKKEHIKDFVGRVVEGTVELVVVYGHPENEPSRKLTMELTVFFDFRHEGKFGLADTIVSERDMAIDAPER